MAGRICFEQMCVVSLELMEFDGGHKHSERRFCLKRQPAGNQKNPYKEGKKEQKEKKYIWHMAKRNEARFTERSFDWLS